MSVYEELEFGGMSSEAFLGGLEVAGHYERLDPSVRLESTAAILGAIGYNIPLTEASPKQLDEIAEAAQQIASRVQHQKVSLEHQRQRQAAAELRLYEDD